ncbi:SDR family NAD(P)-dependent oxidoreductase [Aquibacillus sediminis]|uniref:SDR family NAD(P)-dependent oxidoreductase n=1 Tax=Aquibacillus sediminis TaxID=2574734 RepID=UPI0011081EC5|nr:SDR family NAD(P)-dependent oxidoreductase [Aquibacillus sediminis]
MNILLTGATGFVGKQLTKRLVETGHHVYAIIRNEKKAEKLLSSLPSNLRGRLSIVEGDVTQPKVGITSSLIEELLYNKIDTVYHIAAYLSFDETEKQRTFQVNYEGTKNILELAKQIKVKNFFHVSTAYTLGKNVYANERLNPVENRFVNSYEESKCHAEHLVFEYNEFFHVNIFRPAIIIGDSNTGEAETTFALHGIIRSFKLLKRMKDRKGDWKQGFKFLCNKETKQNLVPIDYVVTVLHAALSSAQNNKIYHITNSNPPTNQKLFELIQEIIGFDGIEMVPTNYTGQLTKEEQKFNQPINVFYQYWENTVTFDDSNTRELLSAANISPLNLDQDALKKIILGNPAEQPA